MPTQTKASASKKSSSTTPASAFRSFKNVNISLAGTFISFPASLVSAAKEDGTGFRLAVVKEGKALPVSQFYTADNKEYLTIGQLGRAVDVGEVLVPLTPEEIASTKVSGTKGIEITQFVDLYEVDPVFFMNSYVVTPNTDPKKGNPQAGVLYNLLLEVMVAKERVGLAKMYDRDKEYNVIIRPNFDGTLLMIHTIHTSSEVRNIEVNTGCEVNPEHFKMLSGLVDTLFVSFDPKGVTSATDSKVSELIARKTAEAQGMESPTPTAADATASASAADPLLAALTASLHAKGVRVVKDEAAVTA